jgi:hypothetical protein
LENLRPFQPQQLHWPRILLAQQMHAEDHHEGRRLHKPTPVGTKWHTMAPAHNPEVLGSNPSPATKKSQVKGRFSQDREPALDRLTLELGRIGPHGLACGRAGRPSVGHLLRRCEALSAILDREVPNQTVSARWRPAG